MYNVLCAKKLRHFRLQNQEFGSVYRTLLYGMRKRRFNIGWRLLLQQRRTFAHPKQGNGAHRDSKQTKKGSFENQRANRANRH